MRKITIRILGKGKAEEIVRDIPDDQAFVWLAAFSRGFIHAMRVEEPRMPTSSSMQLTSITVFRAGSMFCVIRLEEQEEV